MLGGRGDLLRLPIIYIRGDVLKKTGRKKILSLLAFCAPALIFYIVFMAYPMICAFFYSLTDWNGIFKEYNMVGLANYVETFTDDPRFIQSLLYTIKYVVVIVIVENALALMLAVIVENLRRTRTLFRAIFFLPNVLSIYIGSLMWSFVFSRVIPQLSEQALFMFLDQPWLSDKNFAFFSIVMVTLWQGVGYVMIIYIAALQGVPGDLLEAAEIDGASPFQKFRSVTLPMLMPAVTICLFLTLNSSFKIFDVVYSLTDGGPGYSSEVISLNIYREGFLGNLRFGYATAKSMILFLIILVLTLIQTTITKRKEVES